MNLFQFDIENRTLVIFITSIIWAINFRTTFNNIDLHMDSGSYTSLKFDPFIILIKNIICCSFLIVYCFEKNSNQIKASQDEKQIVSTKRGSTVIFEYLPKKKKNNSLLNNIFFLHKLTDSREKIFLSLKIFFAIIIIYISEEIYFIIANNHILDRIICPIRNLGILISLSFFSPLLIKNSIVKYSHQIVPLIIIFFLSAVIIGFNLIKVIRFEKIFGLNFIFYFFSFMLTGLEIVLIKYLVDKLFVSNFFILGLKGIIGTIIFSIFNCFFNKYEFFNFFDKILNFEYDEMYEIFQIAPKIIYVSTLVMIQYFKMYIINRFTINHLLSTLMITDIIYFPLYCIERFVVQKFGISNIITFCFNTLLGLINTFLMLIFNEILECKFWGLNTNLKKNIYKRQIDDIMISLSEINNISSVMTITEDKKGNDSEDEQ
jgi:hypothetical protein